MDFSLRSTYKALCNQDPPLSYYYTLGYLRCRSFPHKMPSSPPPPKKYCYHYSIQVTIPEKSSDATWSVHTLQNFSKLCLKMHQIALRAYSLQRRSGCVCPRTPLGSSWPLATRDSNTLPQTISPRKNPARSRYISSIQAHTT